MQHTFIIWKSGFPHLSQVLWELSNNFEIKHAEKIIWDEEKIPQHLTKIYPNRDFTAESRKVDEIGGNELVVILAVDRNPNLKGGINLNAHDYKRTHRIQGLNYLHASDDEEEALFNFKALLDQDDSGFYAHKKSKTKTYIVDEKKNLKKIVPAKFEKIGDVFDELNRHEEWVILRNWEGLPESMTLDGHDDVDILVRDHYRTMTLLNAKPFFKEAYRVHSVVEIGENVVPFDVRFLGDDYYDEKWEEVFLKFREKEKNFYRLDDENYFWSLLYHAIFHKKKLSNDYRDRLIKMGKEMDGFRKEEVESFQKGSRTLRKFLKKRGYKTTAPKDKSVTIKKNRVAYILSRIVAYPRFLFTLLKRTRWMDLSNVSALKAINSDLSKVKIIKRNVFETKNYIIKKSGKGQRFLMQNEVSILKRLEKYDYFTKVIDHIKGEDGDYLVLSKIEGKDLARYFKISNHDYKLLESGLDEILKILKKEKITHRDLRPHNLILGRDKIHLIDFQFSLIDQKAIPVKTSDQKYLLICCEKNLGGEWKPEGTPNDQVDQVAAEKIKTDYGQKKSFFTHWNEYKNHLMKKLVRYNNYK
jgi:hypothetical protein